jgi:hypothetical protein
MAQLQPSWLWVVQRVHEFRRGIVDGFGETPGWHIDHSILALEAHATVAAPLWPGFAIDTAFYAAILMVAVCISFRLRRRRRIKRGCASLAGYDLRAARAQHLSRMRGGCVELIITCEPHRVPHHLVSAPGRA